MDTAIRPGVQSAASPLRSAPTAVSGAPASSGDTTEIGNAPQTLPGFPQFGVFNIRSQDAGSAEGRQAIADKMADQLKAFPQLTAVVGVLPEGNNTGLVVASRPDAASGSQLAGFYEIMERLCSSSLVRQAAAAHPDAVQPVHAFDQKGADEEITLGGHQSISDVAADLADGGRTDRDDQLQALLDSLPKDQRVVLLIGGPSAAGKSTLISQIGKMANGRNVVDYTGDNYFLNANDPNLPKTPQGGPYWDAPGAMHFDELASDIGKLASTGHVDEPNYDFSAKPPGGGDSSGMRTDKTTPVDLGKNDILCIDSLHAMNPIIINKLEQMKLPYACVYLDSPTGNIREVRRIVRDFVERGRTPEQSMSDWANTTFPGEINFIRPTIDQLKPGQDVFRITQFPKDVDLSQADIEDRVKTQEQYGVEPTYEAFHVPDAGMPAFAKSEEQRFDTILATDQNPADRASAQHGLDLLHNAPAAQKAG